MKKKLLICLLALVVCFGLAGCDKAEIPNNEGTNKDGTEQIDNSNSNLGVGKYKVEKGNKSVSVITNDGSGISTTTYYFANGIITRAELIEEFSSASLAEVSYNTMKNEPAIMSSYSDIKLDGKKVLLTLKTEVLSAYNTLNYDDFYDLMYSTYEAYMN